MLPKILLLSGVLFSCFYINNRSALYVDVSSTLLGKNVSITLLRSRYSFVLQLDFGFMKLMLSENK